MTSTDAFTGWAARHGLDANDPTTRAAYDRKNARRNDRRASKVLPVPVGKICYVGGRCGQDAVKDYGQHVRIPGFPGEHRFVCERHS